MSEPVIVPVLWSLRCSVRVYTGWSAQAADRPAHGAQSPANSVSYPASVAERASHLKSEESELLLRELLQSREKWHMQNNKAVTDW